MGYSGTDHRCVFFVENSYYGYDPERKCMCRKVTRRCTVCGAERTNNYYYLEQSKSKTRSLEKNKRKYHG